MKHYFCRFDENGDPIVLFFCNYRLEEETENARYLTEDELPVIQARMAEMIEEQKKASEDISPDEFLQLIEEAF